mmetsp:Transcript_29113/g.38691  ORF Transcript_29113/g.38691 Transcript_29113/m.38691 type:complete len:99 (+) Transcript_29113:1543-1839(+)
MEAQQHAQVRLSTLPSNSGHRVALQCLMWIMVVLPDMAENTDGGSEIGKGKECGTFTIRTINLLMIVLIDPRHPCCSYYTFLIFDAITVVVFRQLGHC